MNVVAYNKRKRLALNTLRCTTRFLYSCQGTGLPRLAEIVRKRVAVEATRVASAKDIWIEDFCGALFFSCDLTEHMGSQIFFRGAYSGDQLAVLKRLLASDSVFVDAGANQGEFTVCAAAQVPSGKVHAFEPVSAIRERLKANVEANGFRNVQIHGVGLANETRDDVPIFGASAKFSDGTAHAGLPTLYGVDQRNLSLEKINLRRLDDCLPPDSTRVDLIKIDVEGAELFVLSGAENIINASRPYIIFEANKETSQAAGYRVTDITDWLIERSYKIMFIGPGGGLFDFDERRTFSNILAVPKENRVHESAA